MSTPRLPTYIKSQQERRERSMQTAFPAKVVNWNASTNVVELEPQFVETWVNRDGTRESEPQDYPNIENVPVLFPRSGSWAITFPIETGSFGLVVCTKYALDVWRSQGQPRDPGDLRRFGMSGAVFHPVNLHPNDSALSGIPSAKMVLSQGGGTEPVALGNSLKSALLDMFDNLTDSISLITATAISHTAAEAGYVTTRSTFNTDLTTAINSKVEVE